jgi:transposase
MTKDAPMMRKPTAPTALAGPPQSEDERSEAVDGGGPAKAAATASKADPNPEVVAKPTRRKFTAKYKMRILAEADACEKTGDIGRLLRREGLYSSHLANWRDARASGVLGALEPKKRGRKPLTTNPLSKTVAQLEKSNAVLTEKLRQAQLIIEIQKKVAALLGESEETQ